MNDLRSAALALGGEVSGGQVIYPGPGHSPEDRSLSVKFDPAAPDGFVVNTFANDDPIQCKDYVREKLGLPAWVPGDGRDRRVHPSRRKEFDRKSADREAERRPGTEDDLIRIERAKRLWDEGQNPRGTTAQKYLMARALDLPDDLAGTVLRFHPRCPWRSEDTGRIERIPVLLAAFRSVDTDDITAVHRIRLDQPERWPKADRRMLGIVRRAAVKLDPMEDNTLVIGEGVETCMAAYQLMAKGEMNRAPVWALGMVGGIKRLTILGETGEASATAIQLCGRRWHRAGRRVRIIRPDVGSDLNDVLMASSK